MAAQLTPAHLHISAPTAGGGDLYEAVLKKATRVCARRFGINHTTLQVTAAVARRGVGCRRGCGECAVVYSSR